jgi:hypothetical protein
VKNILFLLRCSAPRCLFSCSHVFAFYFFYFFKMPSIPKFGKASWAKLSVSNDAKLASSFAMKEKCSQVELLQQVGAAMQKTFITTEGNKPSHFDAWAAIIKDFLARFLMAHIPRLPPGTNNKISRQSVVSLLLFSSRAHRER